MTSDPMPDLPDLPEQVEINTEAQLEALRSPVRMRVLMAARTPRSVREIAEKLEMPVTRLYYHVNLLHEVGFLEVVHSRKSGARIEKLYRVAGKAIVVGEGLAENASDPAMAAGALASVVLEPAMLEAETALVARITGESDQRIDLGRSVAVLTPERASALSEKLEELIRDYFAGMDEPDDPNAKTYAFTYTFLPTTDL